MIEEDTNKKVRRETIGPILVGVSCLLLVLTFANWSIEGKFFLNLPSSIIAMYFIMVCAVCFGYIYYKVTNRNQN